MADDWRLKPRLRASPPSPACAGYPDADAPHGLPEQHVKRHQATANPGELFSGACGGRLCGHASVSHRRGFSRQPHGLFTLARLIHWEGIDGFR